MEQEGSVLRPVFVLCLQLIYGFRELFGGVTVLINWFGDVRSV